MDIDSYDDVSDSSDDDYEEEGEGSGSRMEDQEDQQDQQDHYVQEDQEEAQDSSKIPNFTMLGRKGNRRPKAQLDQVDDLSPVGIFRTFFNKTILETIIQNTNALEDLWNMDPQAPIHWIAQKMTLMRFQQIKRYLHISELYTDNRPYYAKVVLIIKKIP